jgi:hypothetical protein
LRRGAIGSRDPAVAARFVVETLDVVAEGGREIFEALGLEIDRLARRHGLAVSLVIRPAAGRRPSA